MRGDDKQQSGMFSYISAEQRVPQSHPLRPLRKMVDEALAEMSPRFTRLAALSKRSTSSPFLVRYALTRDSPFVMSCRVPIIRQFSARPVAAPAPPSIGPGWKQDGRPSFRRIARNLLNFWSHPPGSNWRPADYESAALPTELGWPSSD